MSYTALPSISSNTDFGLGMPDPVGFAATVVSTLEMTAPAHRLDSTRTPLSAMRSATAALGAASSFVFHAVSSPHAIPDHVGAPTTAPRFEPLSVAGGIFPKGTAQSNRIVRCQREDCCCNITATTAGVTRTSLFRRCVQQQLFNERPSGRP